MSKVVSLRLSDEQAERLGRAARRLGRSPSEAAARLLEEALRQREFAHIEFRDSPAGRQAFLKGTRLAVWQVANLAKGYDDDAGRTAAYLELPSAQVAGALRYAAAYNREIEDAIRDHEAASATLDRLIPNIETIVVDATSA